MSIDSDDDLHALRRVGRLVGEALAAMERAAEPGMTTADLDAIGAAGLKAAGARSAPQLVYGSLSAHYEETIVVTAGAPIVLTALTA